MDDNVNELPVLTSETIGRRATMKAALGGAVAGAVFVAPRIEGFSIAPDYAAASTAFTTNTASSNFNLPGDASAKICMDGNSGWPCCSNSGRCTGSTTSNFLVASGIGGAADINASVTLAGFLNDSTANGGTNGGSLAVTVDGITDHTNETCTASANHSANCNGWTGPSAQALNMSNANQAQLGPQDLNCSYRIASSSITVSVTCTCA